MARTQAPDYEQRREAIVERAARHFAKNGYRSATLADLAEACDMSKSLIYHYYGSKEDILYAVMASHVDQLLEEVERASAAASEPAERLDALVHGFMRTYVGAADRQKVLLNELDSLPTERRAEIVGKQRRIIAAARDVLVALDPALAGDRAHAQAKTMLLFGMINWTHTWFDPKGPLSAETIADMAVALILNGTPAQPS